jgi:hypothetical protein
LYEGCAVGEGADNDESSEAVDEDAEDAEDAGVRSVEMDAEECAEEGSDDW